MKMYDYTDMMTTEMQFFKKPEALLTSCKCLKALDLSIIPSYTMLQNLSKSEVKVWKFYNLSATDILREINFW